MTRAISAQGGMMDTDGHDDQIVTAEDTKTGVPNNAGRRWDSQVGIPITPANSFMRKTKWLVNALSRYWSAGLFRASARAKAKGHFASIERVFEKGKIGEAMTRIETKTPGYRNAIKTFLRNRWAMKAFRHDYIRGNNAFGTGYINYLVFGFSGGIYGLFAGQVGPYPLGVVGAIRENLMWEVWNEITGGAFEQMETTWRKEAAEREGKEISEWTRPDPHEVLASHLVGEASSLPHRFRPYRETNVLYLTHGLRGLWEVRSFEDDARSQYIPQESGIIVPSTELFETMSPLVEEGPIYPGPIQKDLYRYPIAPEIRDLTQHARDFFSPWLLRMVSNLARSYVAGWGNGYGKRLERIQRSEEKEKDKTASDGGRKMAQFRRRFLMFVTFLGLHTTPGAAVPPIAPAKLPASSFASSEAETVSMNSWNSWKSRIPQNDRAQLEAKTEGARAEVSESVQAYHTKNKMFLESKEKYAASLRGYLEKLERWSKALTAIREGEHMAIFDEAVLRAVDALKNVLRKQLEAIDKVIVEQTIPPGTVRDVSLEQFSSLIQEDPEVQGEFIIPSQVVNQASFVVTAQSEVDFSNIPIGGTLTFTTARYMNHVFQYELPAETVHQEGGSVIFSFDVAQSAQKGHLIRREVDTQGTEDETDDRVVGSQLVSQIDEGYIANVSFQADRNGNSLLAGGKPVVLGRLFVIGNGALRPGSIQITGNDLNALTDTPSPQELVQHLFQFPLSYSNDLVLAPLPEVRGLYGEFNFASLDQRDSTRRSIVSYVVGVPMRTILTRGGTGVETVKIADYPITKVVQEARAGTVTEIPPGPYTVSFNLLDVDAEGPNTQDNDRLARVIRSGTLQVGGLQKAASDTTATEGTWFADGNALYAEENGSAGYAVDFGQEAPTWSVVVYARNRMPASLPEGYRFDMEAYLDGQPLDSNGDGRIDHIRVPADSTGAVRTSGATLGNLSGTHRIRLKWINDAGSNTILQLERLLFIRPSVPVQGTSSGSFFASMVESPEATSSGTTDMHELETKLSRVPESQRFIIEGLLGYMRTEDDLSRAESEIASAAEKMNDAASTLRGAKEGLTSQLNALVSNWGALIGQQPWSEKEKEEALTALRKWLSQDATLGEAEHIALTESPQGATVTREWLKKNREERRRSYGDAYVRFLNLEGPEDLAYRFQYNWPWGSSNLSFSVEDRMRVPYLSPKTEEEKLGDQSKETSRSLIEVQRQLQQATDPNDIARLAEQERLLRKRLVSLEDQSAELENAKRLLHLRDNLFFGLGLDYLPDSNFVMSSRVKFGSPLRFEKTVIGYDYLPSLRRHGVRLEMPPYELSHAIAWHYQDILEAGYSAALISDPGVWTLFSDFVQAHAVFAERLRLGIEHGWLYLKASFDEYLKVIQAREAVLRALDERGISTSFALENIFTRGSLSYSWDNLSLGLAAGEGYYEGRLQGSLFGNMWNIAVAEERMNIRTMRRIGEINLHASLGRDRGEWEYGAGIQGRWGKSPSTPNRPSLSGGIPPSSLEPLGSLQDPKGMLEGTGVHLRTGKPLEWSRPQLPANPIPGVQEGIASLSPLSHPNEEIYEAAIASQLSLRTGINAKLFVQKIRLLDPRTRNLIGKISDQLTLPNSIRKVIQDSRVTVDEALQWYEVLARYFEGVEAKEIKLPEGLTFDAEGLRTAIDLGIIQNSHERQNFSLGEVMGLLFTPAQRQQLDDLKHQALEMETIEKGV
ncbi:MAG: hypothetical protein HY590_00305 [Candidatus Omnitrophica bacterium]|nr:hypothetical protein [Candidatus Omnitrophota bacterium]